MMTSFYGDLLQFLTFANILQNSENAGMQETVLSLRKQIDLLLDKTSTNSQQFADSETDSPKEILGKTDEKQAVKNLNATVSQEHLGQGSTDSIVNSQILEQVLPLSLSGTFSRRNLNKLLLGCWHKR